MITIIIIFITKTIVTLTSMIGKITILAINPVHINYIKQKRLHFLTRDSQIQPILPNISPKIHHCPVLIVSLSPTLRFSVAMQRLYDRCWEEGQRQLSWPFSFATSVKLQERDATLHARLPPQKKKKNVRIANHEGWLRKSCKTW